MSTLSKPHRTHNNHFSTVAAPFIHGDGLPFTEVLDAKAIHRAFGAEDALFAQDDIFSTEVVLWAFLAQCLRDGKGAACASAVADIATYMVQAGQAPPSGDSGDYCRARAKLKPAALRRLVTESASQLEVAAEPSWLWHGRHAKLVDGFTFTMPDTPANQAAFPQNPAQEPGVGLPIARACVILSLATGCVCDLAIAPYAGKETGESALLRGLLDSLDANDVAVFDRYYCSFMMLALLAGHGVAVCTRLHQCRDSNYRRGRRLEKGDYLMTWVRPTRPPWMSSHVYAQIPETLTVREVRFDVREPGRRTERLTLVTTLTDARQYPREDIADLYGFRWNVELDIRSIKQTLHLDHMRCKSPAMVRRELWVTLLAYNLIRRVIATAAKVHDKQPRRLSFTFACQTLLASWMLYSTGAVAHAEKMNEMVLAKIAENEVQSRPGRIEPRVLKRRRHRYPLMKRPRSKLREELLHK